MAKVKLHAGAEIDLLTKGELDDSLSTYWDAEQTARARGIKLMRTFGTTGAISTSVAASVDGPNQGYCWALRLLGVNPASAANIRAWITGDNETTVPINGLVGATSSATFNTVTWSGVQAVMFPGEYLAFSASGAVASMGYVLYALEVPQELLWKVA